MNITRRVGKVFAATATLAATMGVGIHPVAAVPAAGSVPTLGGDIPVMGDWDGDGADTIGVYRSGTWYLRNSNSGGAPDMAFTWGAPGDVPVVGDWDGDGRDTIGVYRKGVWYLRNTNNSGGVDISFTWGAPTDVPLVGDWNGDGKDTIGVYRDGTWFERNTNSSGGVDALFPWGAATDVPVVGDWDGDGKDTVGVRRGSQFMLRNANTSGGVDVTSTVGETNDVAIVGRFDGQPAARTGVRNGTRFQLPTAAGVVTVDYGVPSIVPGTIADVPGGLSAVDARILELTNAARASAGCPALTIDNRLAAASLVHGQNMARLGFFSHTGADGTQPWDRALAAGYDYRSIGENIAAGYSTADAAFTGWMNSAGHRANILNCSYRNVGLSYVAAPGSQWGYYWGQLFGTL